MLGQKLSIKFGKNNKFYTEIDDSYLFGNPFNPKTDVVNKNFKFKLFLNEQKEELSNILGGLFGNANKEV